MARRYPPGPANYNVWCGLTWRHAYRLCSDPLPFTLELARTYGDLAFYRCFTHRVYQINHPDLVRDVLIVKARSFIKQPRQMQVIRQFAGDGLLTAEGELWARQRRIVLPAFQSAEGVRIGEIAVRRARTLVAGWCGGDTLDIHAQMNRLLLGSASEAFFGEGDAEPAAPVGAAMQAVSQSVLRQVSWFASLPEWVPGSARGHIRAARATLHRHVEEAIARRRAGGAAPPGDFLARLLTAVDSPDPARRMSEQQARCEAITMFFAGHHTSATCLSWTLALLAQHPRVLARLQAEADTVLGDRPATPADAPALAYTQQVLKESLRLYPPAWALFARQAVEEVELGGYPIPRGAWMMIYPWVLHRDPRYFPDPEQFDPDRFAPEREESLPPAAFIPFGLGAHACLGARAAMSLLTLVLPTLVQRFSVALSHQGVPSPDPQVSLQPSGPLYLRLLARSPQPRSATPREDAFTHAATVASTANSGTPVTALADPESANADWGV